MLVDFPFIGVEKAAKIWDELKEYTAKIYAEAPITDGKSYKLAQRELQEKESQYFSREEVNQIFP